MLYVTSDASTSPSSTLEWAKICIPLVTPIAVVLVGWVINRRLKEIEQLQWSSRKLIEKRLELYDRLAPDLNKLFCFFCWRGYWKTVSPDDVIAAKRDLDKTMNINRYLLNAEVYKAYQAFIHLLFKTFSGPGHDARILADVQSPHGDRRKDARYDWDESWNGLFLKEGAAPVESIKTAYETLMASLQRCIGITPEQDARPSHRGTVPAGALPSAAASR